MIAARMSTGAFVAGLLLCATAVTLYVLPEKDTLRLIIHEADRNIGTTPVGSTHRFSFLMQNSSPHAIRVVGLAQC